jgi:hypothetical protein
METFLLRGRKNPQPNVGGEKGEKEQSEDMITWRAEKIVALFRFNPHARALALLKPRRRAGVTLQYSRLKNWIYEEFFSLTMAMLIFKQDSFTRQFDEGLLNPSPGHTRVDLPSLVF